MCGVQNSFLERKLHNGRLWASKPALLRLIAQANRSYTDMRIKWFKRKMSEQWWSDILWSSPWEDRAREAQSRKWDGPKQETSNEQTQVTSGSDQTCLAGRMFFLCLWNVLSSVLYSFIHRRPLWGPFPSPSQLSHPPAELWATRVSDQLPTPPLITPVPQLLPRGLFGSFVPSFSKQLFSAYG